MLAVRAAMLTHGRAAAVGRGLAWPEEMDAAVRAYYARELGESASLGPPNAGSADSEWSPVDSASLDFSFSASATTRIARPAG